jgi:tRNA A-37 threonylcarbamoyl transferase component Bud32
LSDPYSIVKHRLCIGGFDWFVSAENQSEDLLKLMGRLSRNETRAEAHLIQERKGHKSWIEQQGQNRFFVKQYFPRNIQNRITYFFRTNRAKTEFKNVQKLSSLGIPVPDLYAYAESSIVGWWRKSYLVFRSYENYVSLKQIEKLNDAASCARGLANEVSSMHRNGVYFGDLHAGNILVNQSDKNNETVTKILFVDFDKTRIYPHLAEDLWVDDLARLNGFVECDIKYRMDFLITYCRLRKLSHVREIYRMVNRRTEQLWKSRLKNHGLDERKYPVVEEAI